MDALPIGRQATLRSIRGIAFVFWGALIVLIDVRIGTFDVVNDFVGALLVAVGVFRLAKLPVGRRYRLVMSALKVVAVASVVISSFKLLPVGITITVSPAISVTLTILELVALFCFLLAMQWLSRAFHLLEALKSWVWTLRFGLAVYLSPVVAAAAFLATVFLLTGQQRDYDYQLSPLAAPAFAILAAPIVHFFLSLVRTLREAAASLS